MDKVLQLQPKFEEYIEEGLEVITVTPDDEDQIMEFWEENQIPGRVFIDQAVEIPRKCEVQSVPVGILVDRDGRIRDRTVGWQQNDAEQWEQKVQELLQE